MERRQKWKSERPLCGFGRQEASSILGIDGLWYSLMREKFGEQMASELDWEIWKRATPLEVRRSSFQS